MIIKTLTLAYFAFLFGNIFELRRLNESWYEVFKDMGFALLLSLLVFLPFKNEHHYDMQAHLDFWPFSFTIALLLDFCIFKDKKLIPRIGEGMTLLHCVVINYLIWEYLGAAKLFFLAIFFIPTAFSFLHAFTDYQITPKQALMLSLLSSFCMLITSGLYVYKVVSMNSVESLFGQRSYLEGILVFADYFFLGAAGPYILQNVMMLFGYFPQKNEYSREGYRQRIKELNQSHVERYSSNQVDKREALVILLIVATFLGFNYHFNFMDSDFAIWVVLVVIPLAVATLNPQRSEVKEKRFSRKSNGRYY